VGDEGAVIAAALAIGEALQLVCVVARKGEGDQDR
jgi:hypothetical protein